MNENGNMYALAALRDRRAKTAGEIAFYKRKVKERKKQLATLDATIRLFDPEAPSGPSITAPLHYSLKVS